MSKSLFEITEEMRWLDEIIDGDEWQERELGDKITEHLNQVEGERDAKLDGYAWLIRRLEHEAEVAEDEVNRWRQKSLQRYNKIKLLKDRLKDHLEAVGQKKVSTDHFTFTVCTNGGMAPIEINEDLVPIEYYVNPPPVIDFKKLRADVESGVDVDGAQLKERGKHLRIK